MEHYTKASTDVIAVGTFAAWLAGWLPLLAAAFSIVWIGMQMVINWDKFTAKVKEWFE